MRFAQTTCKFEGLHFSPRFFYDLMYFLVAMSVNVEEKEIKKIVGKVWRPITPELHLEALQITSPTNVSSNLVKRGSN